MKTLVVIYLILLPLSASIFADNGATNSSSDNFWEFQKLDSCFAENMSNSNCLPKSAILYARVSTDEQAARGYSLQNQEDVLRQYCHLQNIEVQKIFIEDHSAKTFNRPGWKKLMSEVSASKNVPDLLLFTRWDRFSRNTGEAYYIIKRLKKLGIDTQAIEQPLDLSVPENKMMLAFYLAIPEVENDRRSLNVK